MPIIVNSPHNGMPVRIREEDIGRAVRDGQGRIFYPLRKSDGQGFYGSLTRVGGPKEEQRKVAPTQPISTEHGSTPQPATIPHDATGKRRSHRGRWLLLMLVLVLMVAAYLLWSFRKPPSSRARLDFTVASQRPTLNVHLSTSNARIRRTGRPPSIVDLTGVPAGTVN